MKLGHIIQKLNTEGVLNYVWLRQLIHLHSHTKSYTIPLPQLLPFILWHLWNTRNKICFENLEVMPHPKTIHQLATEFFYLPRSSNHKNATIPM